MRSFRFSIAGLMGVVLLLAIGFAALRKPSETWAGVLFLATVGAMGIATIGAFCRRASERGGWLGFAVFGWIYMVTAFQPYFHLPKLPTQSLLELLAPRIAGLSGPFPAFGGMGGMGGGMRSVGLELVCLGAIPCGGGGFGGGAAVDRVEPFFQIGHLLLTLLAASLGALLGKWLFVTPAEKSESDTARSSVEAQTHPRKRWVIPAAIFVSSVALITLIAIGGAILKPGVWAGATFILTWWLIGLMALGAWVGRPPRVAWVGAALFGAGFLMLTYGRMTDDPWPGPPTVAFLNELRPALPAFASGLNADPESITSANAHIHEILNQRIPVDFLEETPLDDVLKSIQKSIAGAGGKGIPMYVDPIGLSESDKTMTSTIRNLGFHGVPLRTSLAHLLNQLDLAFMVKDGLLLITSKESIDQSLRSVSADAYQVVGHCVLALFAAGLGGLVAPLVCGRARTPAE